MNEQTEPKTTPEEMAERIVAACRETAKYWANLPEVDPATGHVHTLQDRCDGVAFSILTALDGCGGLPAMTLTSHVHPEDEDQSDEGVVVETMLHELYHQRED